MTAGPGQSAQLLLEVVPLLDRLAIPHAIVGALAASYFGVVRGSLDADAIISVSGPTTRIDQLVLSLKKLGLSVSLRMGDPSDPLIGVISLEDSHHNRVDLILGIRGMDPAAFSRVVETSLLGSTIRIIGIEDFIAMKLFAGGPIDLNDVRGVLEISRSMIKMDLLRQLAIHFGPQTRASLETLLTEK
ncbi:MAG: hypothetical protein HYZ71_13615 [Deltaproteobacteria bacterium]|nr:hypothetical protein [Deltaproteobacteria bacterium]